MKKEKLTMIELFSGIGAQKRGIDNTALFDCEVLHTSDIDKEAIVSYASIHHNLTSEMVENYKDYPSREEMIKYLIDRNIGFDFQKNEMFNWNKKINSKHKFIEKYWLAAKMANNLGDISKIEKLPYSDLVTYSFPCFVPGTMVLTDKGYKNIENIDMNDNVLTHTNSYQKVVKPMKNWCDSQIYKIDAMCSDPLYVTEEHPFYVRKRYSEYSSTERYVNGNFKRLRKFREPEWVKAKDLTKDYYVGVAINQKSELPYWDGIIHKWRDGRKDRISDLLSKSMNTNEFWWIIGRYLGDGWLRHQGGIIICCAKNETEEITNVLDKLEWNYAIEKERTVNKIHIAFKEIGVYCEQFGRGAINKHLTSDIFNLPVNLLKSFIEGWLSADGCFTQKRFKGSSISKELIYGIGQCVAKVYHTPFSIYKTRRKPICIIEGRTVKQQTSYNIVFKLEKNIQDKAFYEDGYIWCPINKISTEQYCGYVYNMEVENDNSYVVQNIIVHNCTDISQSGRQAGLKKGSGTRSGLLWEVERLLNVAKENNTLPKYLLLENVKNLVQKQFIDDFKEWLSVLDNLGYNTYWEVINGKYCGVPQNRERVFAISVRKDIDKGTYSFPKPFDSGLRLQDVLQKESEIEDKYYLSDYIQKQFHFTDDTLSKNIVGKTDSGGQKSWVYQQNCIMGALTATDYKQPKQILTIEDNDLHQVGRLDIKGFDQLKRVYGSDGIAPTLPTCQGGSQHPKIYSEKKLVRKLTPTECFRLMGFEDDDILRCYDMGVADSSLYKQAGNSIITNCIELLFEHLYKAQYNEDYICTDETTENFQKPQVN